jgi:hypothetical protein
MAEAPTTEATNNAPSPKIGVTKTDPKARQPKLRYQDRPEINEIFADSVRVCVFDGQLMRIEFTVTRLDDPGALGILEGRQMPVCRLVLNRAALVDLLGKVGQLGAALKQAGVVSDQAANPTAAKK